MADIDPNVALAVVGVVLALLVPALVEWSRRPRLRIEPGRDANSEDPLWRIIHVRIISKPLQGPFASVLLRNPAAGCRVTMEFVSRSDGSVVRARGKWSAQPQPLMYVPLAGGVLRPVFDPERIAQTLTLDVSPSTDGEPVAVAVKHNGDAAAYAFDPEIYVAGNLRNPNFELPHEAYEVTVAAHAGEVKSKPRRFLLHNSGTAYRDLRLESVD